jgi:3-oxoacyl-[acyl-carrier-protein] synthase II
VNRQRVAVTGIGIICALGTGKAEVWENMKQNATGIGKMKKFDTSPFLSDMGAELKNYQPTDHFTPEEVKRLDLCGQYAIIAAKEALQESDWKADQLPVERVGVALGTCNGGITSIEEKGSIPDLEPEQSRRYPFYYQGDSVARYFGLKGPVNTINTACAASGNAIGYAVDMIREGYADMMLAGGSDPMSLSVYAGFNVLQALNPQPCSPYNRRYGLSLGEGAAFVMLEPLEQAVKRGATIYAEVCGYGLSNDAYHATAPEPEGAGIRYAVELALKHGQVSLEQVGYVNTHGTGTKANDPAELNGLRTLFGKEAFSRIPVSSSKAYFGHNLGAAAAIEYVTTLLAMKEGLLPATLHFEAPREGCEDANLIVNEMRAERPKYFLCNNAAFGGHNASIISRNAFADSEGAPRRRVETKRVAIVGLGMVGSFGSIQGPASATVMEGEYEPGSCDFSLKAFHKALYERRMNRLSQFSIGASYLALQDAKLTITEENAKDTGIIYGTSHGSLESAEKYVGGIFEKGPGYASGIYFPDMVLNSTAGKIAMKLGVKGVGSSLSTGGNDGLMSALYGYETVRNGIQSVCLVGAGDERSELASIIHRAEELEQSPYPIAEGSGFFIAEEMEHAKARGADIYAEIRGFGTGFAAESEGLGEEVDRVARMALERAEISADGLDFILYSTAHDEPDVKRTLQVLVKEGTPVTTLNSRWGYLQSTSSLYHLQLAAEWVAAGQVGLAAATEAAPSGRSGSNRFSCRAGLVIGTSVNGNIVAAVVHAAE